MSGEDRGEVFNIRPQKHISKTTVAKNADIYVVKSAVRN